MHDFQSMVTEHAIAFEQYYELLVEWNERMNLTAITERTEVYAKHFVDSLLVAAAAEWREVVETGGTVADVGTGAGFPGLPLAICFPTVSFVLCDSLQKRVQFVEHVCQEIGLENVTVVHGRAEDLARMPAYRNRFDAVVSRAVARLNVLAEIALPFVRRGGVLFAYKGPGVVEELEDGRRAAGMLGAEVERTEHLQLPGDKGERVLVVLRQQRETPKAYPRKPGTPQKKPL